MVLPPPSHAVRDVMSRGTPMRPMTALLLLGLAGCGDSGSEAVPVPPATVSQSAATGPAPSAPEPPRVDVVMDVMEVVGNSETGVAGLLGEPTSCEQVHRARWCRYGPYQDEVMFVAGKADMITVHGMGAVAFNADALGALGLEPATPEHADEIAIRWESLPDLEEVSVFPASDGSIEYAYVKVGRH